MMKRSRLTGTAFGITRPYGEDTDYARAMRLRPEKLAEIIAIVDDETLRSIARTYNVSPQTISRLAA